MAADLPQNYIIAQPFAENASNNYKTLDIPQTPASSNTNRASWSLGFPQITFETKAPSGADFNRLFNIITQLLFNAQSGGMINLYSAEASNAQGGYPLNAIVWYLGTGANTAAGLCLLRSTVANNNNIPFTSGVLNSAYWEKLLPVDVSANSVRMPDFSKYEYFLGSLTSLADWKTDNVLTLSSDAWVDIYSDRNGKWTITIINPDGTSADFLLNSQGDDNDTFSYPFKAGTKIYPSATIGATRIRIIPMMQ